LRAYVIITKMEPTTTRYNHDLKNGLSSEQVKDRIDNKLTNKTKIFVGKSYGRIIFDNVFSFFNILLFIIAGLMIWAKYYDGLFFLIVLIPNIIIGLYEDISARRLMGKLHVLNSPKAKVLRDGKLMTIEVDNIVLDEIIQLSMNDQISADCILIDGQLGVNESLLTGESVTVHKNVGDVVYSGSYVTSGSAYVYADKIGYDTYLESIQNSARKFKRSKSEILSTLKKMFRVIGALVIILGGSMIAVYASQGRFNTIESFQNVIGPISGSMVSMIPSGLYLLTSAALAVGVISLSKKHAHVQDFYSIEMLARSNVLCVDKTGTITDGTMSVNQIITFNKYSEDDAKKIITEIVNATKDNNATAAALSTLNVPISVRNPSKVLPFNSENKYSGVSFDGETYIVGAPEFLDIENKDELVKEAKVYTSKGYRVLVVGTSKKPLGESRFEGILKTVCLVVLQDHIKEDAEKTFEWFKQNNVDIRVISGDNAITVSEIARQVGICDADKYISLEGMSLEDVRQIACDYVVFGRVSPEQKAVIVETLQKNGKTVAMTGDGVNDILALKKADCSIAMASGAEAAKNVSHIVLSNSNFSSLPDVVAEGRRVINNLQRTCSLFLVKTIFAVITTTVFLFISLGTGDKTISYPFLTNHMYIWEVVNVGISAFFLALERNNEIIKGKFLTNIFSYAIPGAVTILLSQFAIFGTWWMTKYCGVYTSIISEEAAISLCVLSFTIISNFVLLKVCKPFDKYRAIVYGCASLADLLILVISACVSYSTNKTAPIFKISFNLLSPPNYVILGVCVLVALALYFYITYLMKILKDKNYGLDEKEDERNECKNKQGS